MLLGLGHRPAASLPVLNVMDDEEARMAFDATRDRAGQLAATLPSQYEYLRDMFAASAASATRAASAEAVALG
jgi:hypothetical protein